MQSFMSKVLAAVTVLVVPSLVMAHPGHETTAIGTGILSGALHPLLGLDHLLTLMAVGVLSARLSGKQKFLVPLCFVGLMLAGFMFAHEGVHLVSAATMETLIVFSLCMAAVFVVLGKVLQHNTRFHELAAWAVTAFASIHGMAHGLEIPLGASAMGFAAGFAMACLMVMVVVHWVCVSIKSLKVQSAA